VGKHRLVGHWRDGYDEYIGRGKDPLTGKPGEWGNPFSHKEGTLAKYRTATRAESILFHRRMVLADPAYVERIRRRLKGKRLGCWCKQGQSCHGDVYAEIANGEDWPELDLGV
jgi:hypothetical protein